MSRSLEIEVVKLRNLPQSDYDPLPCTSQVRLTLWNDEGTEAISTEQSSSVQAKNNMPFFKDNFFVPLSDEQISGTLLFSVWEFSRQDDPYVLFYGRLPVSLQAYKNRKEEVIILTVKDPSLFPEEAEQEREEISKLGDGAPSLTVKVLMPKLIEKTQDKNADVDLPFSELIVLSGNVELIPKAVEFVWMRLLLDKIFSERYRRKLVSDWIKRAPLEAPVERVEKRKKSTANFHGNAAMAREAELNLAKEVKNIGDVILKRWCSRRPHQVLTRVRLTAEKFIRSPEEPLVFTTEEEISYREKKKKRSILVSRMCLDSLSTTGKNSVRDWMERLWALYTVGIDNDPSGSRALSYEVRKKVMESVFEMEDAIILRASLLNALLPALTYEKCQELVEDDIRNTPDVVFEKPEGFEQKITVFQRYFTKVLGEFIGDMMDTLTDAELVRFCNGLKPAVFDAHQRVQTNHKAGIRGRVRPADVEKDGLITGSGIQIEHLDKYGHRKKVTYFA